MVDGGNVTMRVRVNGEQWGEDTSAHMHHTFGAMIAYASRSQTLYPGEVLGSGTAAGGSGLELEDRKSTRLNSSHLGISYAVFCLKKKKTQNDTQRDKAKQEHKHSN